MSLSSVVFPASFFVTGVATVLLSSLLPQLETIAGARESLVGRMLALQFAGQLAGALALRGRANRMLMLGALLTAAAALLLSLHFLLHPLELFGFGFGLGLTMSAVNAIVDQESPADERMRKLELLNVFWPLGAALSPWLVNHASLGRRPGLPYAVLSLLFAILALYAGLRPSLPERCEEAGGLNASPQRLVRIALLGFLAVGVETAVANWLPTLSLEYPQAAARVLPDATLFWLGILLSRVAASRLLHENGMQRFPRLCAAVACVALLGIAGFRSAGILSLCAIVAALALGPVYPVLIGAGLRLRWKGMIFFSAGLGSVLVPWVVGRVSTARNSLHAGMFTAAAGCLLLALGSGLGSGRISTSGSTEAPQA